MSPRAENAARPLIGVGAVIFDAERRQVLLIQRGHAPAAGSWSVPGGLVDRGEALAAACAREVEEETGLRVHVAPEPVKLIERVIRRDEDVAYHYLIVDFMAEILGGELKAGDDAAAVEWVPLDGLAQRLTTAGLQEALGRAQDIALGREPKAPLLSRIDSEEERP